MQPVHQTFLAYPIATALGYFLQPAAGATDSAGKEPDWIAGENVHLGGVLFPHLHFNATYGHSTSDNPEELTAGHHDPNRNGWTIQGLEPGMSLRCGEYLEGFANGHLVCDVSTSEWSWEMEEWFAKAKNLPLGLELRGGKFLNRFGQHNSAHLHGWDFADSHLPHGRYLGDDGLFTLGGEVSWAIPVDSMTWTSLLSLSLGEAQRPDHEHSHEDDNDHEPEVEAEGAAFADLLTTANWTNLWRLDDFHQIRVGISGAWGANLWSLATQVYGLHIEYQWRENGLEAGGSYFRWRTEALVRHFNARTGGLPGEEHYDEQVHGQAESQEEGSAESRSFTEFGVVSSAVYGQPTPLAGPLELALRGEFVSGQSAAGLDRRCRLSPTVRLYANSARTAYLGLQYNLDHGSEVGTEHSVWLQVGFNWGGAEVR